VIQNGVERPSRDISIWVLIDCARHEPRKGNDRIVWVLIIALTHLVGALIYFFARRPERIREHGA